MLTRARLQACANLSVSGAVAARSAPSGQRPSPAPPPPQDTPEARELMPQGIAGSIQTGNAECRDGLEKPLLHSFGSQLKEPASSVQDAGMAACIDTGSSISLAGEAADSQKEFKTMQTVRAAAPSTFLSGGEAEHRPIESAEPLPERQVDRAIPQPNTPLRVAAASGIDAAEYAAAIDEILRSPQGSAFAKMMAEERLVRQEATETAAEYEEMAQAESERAQAAEAEAQALKNEALELSPAVQEMLDNLRIYREQAEEARAEVRQIQDELDLARLASSSKTASLGTPQSALEVAEAIREGLQAQAETWKDGLATLTRATAKAYRVTTDHSYEWLRGSTNQGLAMYDTVIDLGAAAAAAPNIEDKAIRAEYTGARLASAFGTFRDGTKVYDYGRQRQYLGRHLYGITRYQGDAITGDGSAFGFAMAALQTIVGGGSSDKYKVLKNVFEKLQGAPRDSLTDGLRVQRLLEVLDDAFVPPTAVSRTRFVQEQLNELTPQKGSRPSDVLDRVQTLYSDVRGLAGSRSEEEIKNEVQDHLFNLAAHDADSAAALEPFTQKLSDLDFRSKSLASWRIQFRVIEDMPTTKAAFAALLRGKGAAKSGLASRVAFADMGDSGGVAEPTAASSALIAAIQSLEKRMAEDKADMLQQLSRGINLANDGQGGSGNRSGGLFGEEWVAKNGVVGKPAPNDPNRHRIYVSRICEKKGWSLDGLPNGPKPLVGDKCAACRGRGFITRWFYNPYTHRAEFDSHGKVAKPAEKGCGYYHDGATCTFAFVEAHRWCKAHPEDTEYIFAVCPADQSPYGR